MTHLETQWLVDGQLLFLTQTGSQSAAEASIIFDWLVRELDTHASSRCHALFLPVALEPQYSAFQSRKISQAFFEHPKLGWVVHVEKNLSMVIHIMVRAAIQLAKSRYQQFKTTDEGITFLQEADPTLPRHIIVPDLKHRPFEEWIKDKLA